MTTTIYISVNGTCTASPDENLFELIPQFKAGKPRPTVQLGKKTRTVTGGATVLYVMRDGGIEVFDSGDFDDRKTLEESLAKIKDLERIVDPTLAIPVYATHCHPDHIGNHDLFAKHRPVWIVDYRDMPFVKGVLGPECAGEYKKWEEAYAGHKKRGITQDKFEFRDFGMMGATEITRARVLDTPGHDLVHNAFVFEDDGVVIRNLESGSEVVTKKAVFTGDCLCDERYLERYLSTNPAVRKTAVYGNRIPTEQWLFPTQGIRDHMDQLNLESMERILREAQGSYLIFGHGGEYKVD